MISNMTYYQRNREFLLARQKEYYRKNKEYYQQYNEEYFQTVTKPHRRRCMQILREHNLLTKPPSVGKVKVKEEPQEPVGEILVYALDGCVIEWN
jgi:hypothetical protein